MYALIFEYYRVLLRHFLEIVKIGIRIQYLIRIDKRIKIPSWYFLSAARLDKIQFL